VRSLELIVFLPLSAVHMPRTLVFSRSASSNFALMDLLFANQYGAASSALLTHTAARNIVFKFASNLAVQSKESTRTIYKPKAKISSWNRVREYFVVISDSLQAKTQKNWRVELIASVAVMCALVKLIHFYEVSPHAIYRHLWLICQQASWRNFVWRKVRHFYWRMIPDDCTLGMRLSCELCWGVTISASWVTGFALKWNLFWVNLTEKMMSFYWQGLNIVQKECLCAYSMDYHLLENVKSTETFVRDFL
jgi:hypothetical protein